MEDLTATERELARILREDGGHTEADISYYLEQLRQLMAMRALQRLVGRKLTGKERQHAHVQLREGVTAEQLAAKLTKP